MAIGAGGFHTCALLDNGTVRCWGFGAEGRLGYVNTNNVSDDETPGSVAPVDLGGTAKAISAGYGHTCALLEDGTVRCWGYAVNGALGYGNTDAIGDDETPAEAGAVKLGRPATAISAGQDRTREGHRANGARGLVVPNRVLIAVAEPAVVANAPAAHVAVVKARTAVKLVDADRHRGAPRAEVERSNRAGGLVVADRGRVAIAELALAVTAPAAHGAVVEPRAGVAPGADRRGGAPRAEVHRPGRSGSLVVPDRVRVGRARPRCARDRRKAARAGCAGPGALPWRRADPRVERPARGRKDRVTVSSHGVGSRVPTPDAETTKNEPLRLMTCQSDLHILAAHEWGHPACEMTRSPSSTRTEWTASEFQAELDQFKHALRAAGLKEATIHSYLAGSSRFVRWLAGEYAPGPGPAAPSTSANRASELGLSDRDAAIVLARERGDTLQEIGTRFGISRERVRQILIDT